MSLPAFYYLFILDVNFLIANTPGTNNKDLVGLSYNFSNKILIISSIFMFHVSPFLLNKEFLTNFFQNFKKITLFTIIVFIICLPFFNYSTNFTGGGIFFQISNFFLDNNYIFYFFSFLSLLLVGYFSYKNLNNFLIFFVLIISNVQNTIYHKYYDPLILILFFTVFINSLSEYFFKKNINLFYLYSFYFVFISLRIIKNSAF
tara:strand:+ start:479 stop:1087 length:609 start_codon:yes stop_codon:yes gene_type:complete